MARKFPPIERLAWQERPEWRALASSVGFDWHTGEDGRPYWTERYCYALDGAQVERDIEHATVDLTHMCLAAVAEAFRSEANLLEMGVPEILWQPALDSWKAGTPDLVARFDLAWNGTGPAKMLEINTVAAGSCFETAVFQWLWFEEMRAAARLLPGTDQFNRLHDCLIGRFRALGADRPMHFSALARDKEDTGTVRYLMDCALQGGVQAVWLPIESLGHQADGSLQDMAAHPVHSWLLHYPHELMALRGHADLLSRPELQVMEPTWRSVMGSKGLLALLWKMFPGHPNLLPAFFGRDAAGVATLGSDWVRKPVHGFGGQGIVLSRNGTTYSVPAPPGQPPHAARHVYQAPGPVMRSKGMTAIMGSWMVSGVACGLGIREALGSLVTTESTFVPHYLR